MSDVPAPKPDSTAPTAPTDFLRQIVAEERRAGKHGGQVVTRFPPEPNGFLHLGHVKAITIDFGIAAENDGACFLRFDDTNPMTEDVRFITSIQEDVRWLGYDWGERLRFASDYYDGIYACAEELIRRGKAYVDSQTAEQIRETRGKPGEPGKESPFRGRSVDENLALFRQMKSGELPDGAAVLRAKIDMGSPNFNLRDPALYRIRHEPHPRTGDRWCIYPMYDYAHPLSDAFEGTTHSLCTLEFEDHRPLYDWVLDELADFLPTIGAKSRPRQIEFARLAVEATITSKRKLKELVNLGHVDGWDDPRLATVAGMRRRGIPAAAIRAFAEKTGVSKNEGVVEYGLWEHTIREELERTTRRALCVVRPLKITLTDWPEGEERRIEAAYHPTDPSMGSRALMLTRELYVEQSDFMLDPPKKFFRLGPGREVRLRWGPIIKCKEVVKNDAGEVVELRCTHDPASLEPGGGSRKVKGTIHWVSAKHGVPIEARLYDRLFAVAQPTADPEVDYKSHLNPRSLEIVQGAVGEPSLAHAAPGERFQFERTGYFAVDTTTPKVTLGGREGVVFNRTVGLRDSWAKVETKAEE